LGKWFLLFFWDFFHVIIDAGCYIPTLPNPVTVQSLNRFK
jgi:hypothetical protein